MVGVVGLEPTASCPPDKRSAKLSYTPLSKEAEECMPRSRPHVLCGGPLSSTRPTPSLAPLTSLFREPLKWSEWLDSNQRFLPSEGSRLPDFLTLRYFGWANRNRTYIGFPHALTVRCIAVMLLPKIPLLLKTKTKKNTRRLFRAGCKNF